MPIHPMNCDRERILTLSSSKEPHISLSTAMHLTWREGKKNPLDDMASIVIYAVFLHQPMPPHGCNEGRVGNILNNVRALIDKKGWSPEEALDILNVSPEDRQVVMSQL